MSLHSRPAQAATTGNRIIQRNRLSGITQLTGTINSKPAITGSKIVQLEDNILAAHHTCAA